MTTQTVHQYLPAEDLPGIIEDRKNGVTLQEIADRYGITREAVRQRLMRYGGQELMREIRAVNTERRQREEEEQRRAVEKRRREARRTLSTGGTRVLPRKSNDQLAQELHDYIERTGDVPASTPNDSHPWPEELSSTTTYTTRFGTWSNALAAAGEVPRWRAAGGKYYSNTDLIDSVVRFLKADPIGNGRGGAAEYEKWQKMIRAGELPGPVAPSTALIRQRIGWGTARAMALRVLNGEDAVES